MPICARAPKYTWSGVTLKPAALNSSMTATTGSTLHWPVLRSRVVPKRTVGDADAPPTGEWFGPLDGLANRLVRVDAGPETIEAPSLPLPDEPIERLGLSVAADVDANVVRPHEERAGCARECRRNAAPVELCAHRVGARAKVRDRSAPSLFVARPTVANRSLRCPCAWSPRSAALIGIPAGADRYVCLRSIGVGVKGADRSVFDRAFRSRRSRRRCHPGPGRA